MFLVRLCKAGLVGSIALFFSLVAYGNIADYDSNWQFVQHVLSMDTTFPHSGLHLRAIIDPTIQSAAYWLIIATETLVALLLWAGTVRLLAAIGSRDFNRAKALAIGGLSLGFLLYAVGFISIGGEWFAMWQSAIWNGQQKAFGFIGMIAAVLIVVMLSDPMIEGDGLEA